jgi:hypothetical protein
MKKLFKVTYGSYWTHDTIVRKFDTYEDACEWAYTRSREITVNDMEERGLAELVGWVPEEAEDIEDYEDDYESWKEDEITVHIYDWCVEEVEK